MTSNLICAIFVSIAVLLLLRRFYKKEKFTDAEAIQNVASIYNSQKLTVSSLDVTGATNLLPKGTVIMWSGDEKDVPLNWALCDGKDGRPDLRGRFVLGSGVGGQGSDKKALYERKINTAGGAEHTYLTSPDQLAPHHHQLFATEKTYLRGDGVRDDMAVNMTCNEWGGDWNYGLCGAAYIKPHKGVSSTIGKSAGVNIMPPFYVLAYIIRVV